MSCSRRKRPCPHKFYIVMPIDITTLSNWTDEDTRLAQYCLLTNLSFHSVSTATFKHHGVRIFGSNHDQRQATSHTNRCNLRTSLKSFKNGSNRSKWQILPEDYDPTEYLGNISPDIIHPLPKEAYLSQFPKSSNNMVCTLLKNKDACIIFI